MNQGLGASGLGGVAPRLQSESWWYDLALDKIPGAGDYLKFGRNPAVGTVEDIWDGSTLWSPPTVARIHDLAGVAADAAAGTGLRTGRLWGLPNWDTREVHEDFSMNGITNVPTAGSYVIIHRMKGLTWGSGGENAGNITCTAQTDASLTAQITAGKNQTLMSILGIPSTQRFLISKWFISINSGGAGARAQGELLVNETPQDDPAGGFLVKRHLGANTDGDSAPMEEFRPFLVVDGPAIIKVQVEVSSAADVAGAFDGVLVDK